MQYGSKAKEEVQKVIDQLKGDVNDGGITLVLGAGVNVGAGLPLWGDLLSSLSITGCDTLDMLKAFEQLSYRNLGEYTSCQKFNKKIKQELYREDKNPSQAGTLTAIADVIVADCKSSNRKIRRVITLNVDSLLEELLLERGKGAVAIDAESDKQDIDPHPITNWYQAAKHYRPSIDIYHLHGFLPSDKYSTSASCAYSSGLVLGDDEYWDMTSRPSSLPNVVMMNALHDSHCVFIGLSMKDPNIARWLALRANEIKQSKWQQSESSKGLSKLLARHYWIEQKADSLRIDWLKSRGVKTIKIKDWCVFSDMFKDIFNNQTRSR